MNDYSSWQQEQTAEHPPYATGSLGTDSLVPSPPLSRGQRFAKRSLDVAVSLFLLCLLLPALTLISLAVLAESGRPLFFRQKRGGLDGRSFSIVKFRTMRVMEDGPELAQARRNDPRVTPLGAFLRRTSLDELPQLWNVLMGDMSLVGPRPHALAHDQYYGGLLQRYPLRQRMKPGITGLAQIGGWRGETATLEAMAGRVEADIHYIDHWSFLGDLKILLRTARVVLFDRSAY
jgi:putative colanic acid biosynthesis UDP-glucose lipid carrier transferase